MLSMSVQAVLAVVLILFTSTVKTQQGEIKVWKKEVTLTCPGHGIWFEDDKVLTNNRTDEDGNEIVENVEGKSYKFIHEGNHKYHCEYPADLLERTKYYFRFEGKTCENCYELDAVLLAVIIVVDIVGTTLVMIIIYRCTKNKSPAAPAQSSKAPARSGGRPPPGSSSEYEQLNRQTRSQDTYSVVNRTG